MKLKVLPATIFYKKLQSWVSLGLNLSFFFSFYRTIERKEKDGMLIYIFKMPTHIKSSKLLLGYTKICNHPKPPTTIHNYTKPPTTTHNYPQLPIIIHNHLQPSSTIDNHPKTTQKSQGLSQTGMLLHFRCSYCNRRWVWIVIQHNGIYTCVCFCGNKLSKSWHWQFFG